MRIRTHLSGTGSTAWEAQENRSLFLASTNTTYEIFPALKMYGRMPLGQEMNRPLTPLPNCIEFLPVVAKNAATVTKGTASAVEPSPTRGQWEARSSPSK